MSNDYHCCPLVMNTVSHVIFDIFWYWLSLWLKCSYPIKFRPHLPAEGLESRVYQNCFRLLLLLLPSSSPDYALDCYLQISVGTAGLQRQAPELSGHCRTSTASARAQWVLRDLHCECKMSNRMSERMSEYMSDRMSEKMSEYMSDRMSWCFWDSVNSSWYSSCIDFIHNSIYIYTTNLVLNPLIQGTAPSCHLHGSGGTVAATAQDETACVKWSASSIWRSGWLRMAADCCGWKEGLAPNRNIWGGGTNRCSKQQWGSGFLKQHMGLYHQKNGWRSGTDTFLCMCDFQKDDDFTFSGGFKDILSLNRYV